MSWQKKKYGRFKSVSKLDSSGEKISEGTFSPNAGDQRHSHPELLGYEGRGNGKGHEYKGMKQKQRRERAGTYNEIPVYSQTTFASDLHDHGGNPKNWTNYGTFFCHD